MIYTEAQIEAINDRSRLLVINSLAGTGKTTTIVQRIKKIILDDGVSPDRIMAITFTNKMGEELQEKLPELKWVGNFHKIALRLINKCRGEHTVLPENEWKDLVKDVEKRTFFKKNGIKLLAGYKDQNRLRYDEQYFIEEYRKFMSWNKLLTYDDIEIMLLDMLGKGEIKEKFRHFIVDEFQDTTEIEMDIVERFDHDYLTIVGDSSQNIYEWRGTRVENILEMAKKADKVIVLDESFRVPLRNLPVVNHILGKINLNTGPMKTFNKVGNTTIYTGRTSEDVIREIMPKLLSIFAPSEIAILCRYNQQVTKYSDIVKEMTPKVNAINARVGWNSKVGMKILMFIRFCLGDKNNYALNSLFRAIEIDDPMVIQKWLIDSNIAISNGDNKSIIEVAMEGDNTSKNLIKDLLTVSNNDSMTMTDKINHFYEAYVTDRVEASFYQIGDRVIFERIKEGIDNFIKKHGNDNRALYRWALTMDAQDFVDTDSNMNIMTYHVAKGLEFPVVIMPDIQDSIFPKNYANLQADYRLCYVGATRAKNLLYLIKTGESVFVDDFKEDKVV